VTERITQAERLTKIETLLETKLDEIVRRLDGIEKHQTQQDKESAEDRAELAALKNKGAGILIGVGLAGGAIGAAITAGFETLAEFFR
jgi:hypothetical protein